MGQSRGVQVVNFVGQGSIEEGILSILAFKKSLFAGVLDGGADEVFMQGTRLSQFMKSVEQVAGAMGDADAESSAIGEAEVAQPSHEAPSAAVAQAQADIGETGRAETGASTPGAMADGIDDAVDAASQPEVVAQGNVDAAGIATDAPVAADPWAAILEAGAALLQGLAASRGAGSAAASSIAIERDPVTGQASIRLPLPDPAVLQRLAKAFEPWLKQ